MGHVLVSLETTSTDEKTGFPVDLSFWGNLWDCYVVEFQEVIIHCWDEEKAAIEELSVKASNIKDEGLIQIFTLTLTEENRVFLRDNSIDSKGGLKWFTMFFHEEGDEVIEIGHYGSEIILYKVNEEEADKFSSLFPQTSTIEYYEEHS